MAPRAGRRAWNLFIFMRLNESNGEPLKNLMISTNHKNFLVARWLAMALGFLSASCAPRIVEMQPLKGFPGDTVSLSFEYLVGWPRVEIGNVMMDWPQLRLQASDPTRRDVPGEELIWIEDKILHFKIPELAPGDYQVTIHDDKGPPGDWIYSFLETTAYLAFPPVWPFVLRSNQVQVGLQVLSRK